MSDHQLVKTSNHLNLMGTNVNIVPSIPNNLNHSNHRVSFHSKNEELGPTDEITFIHNKVDDNPHPKVMSPNLAKQQFTNADICMKREYNFQKQTAIPIQNKNCVSSPRNSPQYREKENIELLERKNMSSNSSINGHCRDDPSICNTVKPKSILVSGSGSSSKNPLDATWPRTSRSSSYNCCYCCCSSYCCCCCKYPPKPPYARNNRLGDSSRPSYPSMGWSSSNTDLRFNKNPSSHHGSNSMVNYNYNTMPNLQRNHVQNDHTQYPSHYPTDYNINTCRTCCPPDQPFRQSTGSSSMSYLPTTPSTQTSYLSPKYNPLTRLPSAPNLRSVSDEFQHATQSLDYRQRRTTQCGYQCNTCNPYPSHPGGYRTLDNSYLHRRNHDRAYAHRNSTPI